MRRKGSARRCGTAFVAFMITGISGIALAACSTGGQAQTFDGRSTGTASAAPSAGVSTRAAAAALPAGVTTVLILRAYQGFWAAQVQALDTGDLTGSELPTYSTGQALSAVDGTAFRLTQAGLRMSGAPNRVPRVTAIGPVSAADGVQTATIQDCVDVTGWHQVDAATHRLRDPAKRVTRYQSLVTARTVGGVWMITTVQDRTDRTC